MRFGLVRNWQLYAAILLVVVIAQFRRPIIEFARHPISQTVERFAANDPPGLVPPIIVEAKRLLTKHAIHEYGVSRLIKSEDDGSLFRTMLENLWPLRPSTKTGYMIALIDEDMPANSKEIDRMQFVKLIALPTNADNFQE
jgi:hypothetical protein